MRLVNLLSVCAALLCINVSQIVLAQEITGKEKINLMKKLEPIFGVGEIQHMKKTPYAGLIEIETSQEILYTDKEGKYIIAGKVLEVSSRKDLTTERWDEINKVDFENLPFNLAIKTVKGNGERKLAVFEDPNCIFCKKFWHTLETMDNITIYSFQYNVLSPDSIIKSRDIWCSADREKAMKDWMLNGALPQTADSSCVSPHEQILLLGKKYKILGTPGVIFEDGTRAPGAVDANYLENKFKALKK